jgi:hypothetical protein
MNPAKGGKSTLRTWLIRGGIAVLVGLAIGAGTGVFTVNTLEPGRGNGVDSLQVMLDSISRGIKADSAPPAAEAPATEPVQTTQVDSIPVPSLAELEEGAARNAIRDAGLQVGEVIFQANLKPAGTVISSAPAVGTFVARGSAVSLTLSDGRPPTDTLFDTLSDAKSRP